MQALESDLVSAVYNLYHLPKLLDTCVPYFSFTNYIYIVNI